MKKPVLTTSLCAFTMLLTACGGSGSVVSNNAPSVTPIPSNPSTNNSNSSANNSTNTNTNTGATNPIEGAFITLDNNTRWGLGEPQTTSSTQLETIVVDNQPITLYFDSDKNTAFDAYDTITSYEYAYHGYAKPKNQTSVIFAQGQPTPLENIPATGVATYNGKAVHIDNATISHRDVNFNINFADKTFTGQIAIADKSRAEYELAGVVKDNQLANASITAPFIKGGFYGPNAEEIAGVYSIYENGSVVGSFGAEKQ